MLRPTLGGMQRLDGPARLIHKVLAVIIRQVLRADDAVKIRFEQFLDEVDLFERVERAWLDDVEHGNQLRGTRRDGQQKVHSALMKVRSNSRSRRRPAR